MQGNGSDDWAKGVIKEMKKGENKISNLDILFSWILLVGGLVGLGFWLMHYVPFPK